jgi:hypothetical protein
VGEDVREQQRVVAGEAARQRLPQGGKLLGQPAAGELRQRLRIWLALQQCPEHQAAGGAEHVGGHRGELDVGVLEQLVEAVRLALALADERLAVAG